MWLQLAASCGSCGRTLHRVSVYDEGGDGGDGEYLTICLQHRLLHSPVQSFWLMFVPHQLIIKVITNYCLIGIFPTGTCPVGKCPVGKCPVGKCPVTKCLLVNVWLANVRLANVCSANVWSANVRSANVRSANVWLTNVQSATKH